MLSGPSLEEQSITIMCWRIRWWQPNLSTIKFSSHFHLMVSSIDDLCLLKSGHSLYAVKCRHSNSVEFSTFFVKNFPSSARATAKKSRINAWFFSFSCQCADEGLDVLVSWNGYQQIVLLYFVYVCSLMCFVVFSPSLSVWLRVHVFSYFMYFNLLIIIFWCSDCSICGQWCPSVV